MIVTYLRSSSYSAWSFCQQSFFLTYNLGIRDTGNKKAEMGNMTHKALELLASQKLAMQNGSSTFVNDELDQTFDVATFTPEQAADLGIAHYQKKSIHTFTGGELRKARQWMYDAMSFHNGLFNPLKRQVLWPEKYFDIEIEADWARYKYRTPFGDELEGRLAIKGTIDLVCNVDGFPNVVENVDWKTGSRIDWGTGEEKTVKKLRNDPQLRLYHYALSKLLPDAEQIIVSIVWIRDGGPFTLPPFTKADLPETERMIRERFEEIRDSRRPKLAKSWRCSKFCFFGRNSLPGSSQTICEEVNQSLLQIGMDRTIQKFGKRETLVNYGDGGGRSNVDQQEAKP